MKNSQVKQTLFSNAPEAFVMLRDKLISLQDTFIELFGDDSEFDRLYQQDSAFNEDNERSMQSLRWQLERLSKQLQHYSSQVMERLQQFEDKADAQSLKNQLIQLYHAYSQQQEIFAATLAALNTMRYLSHPEEFTDENIDKLSILKDYVNSMHGYGLIEDEFAPHIETIKEAMAMQSFDEATQYLKDNIKISPTAYFNF